MALTYTAITTTTVGAGGVSSITFSSIPQTYTDLLIRLSGRSAESAQASTFRIALNGSVSSFSGKGVWTTSPNAFTYRNYNNSIISEVPANSRALNFGNTELYIPGYTVVANKGVSIYAVAENFGDFLINRSYLFRSNTAAITSITLDVFSANVNFNWAQNTNVTLYGIKNL